MIREIFKGSDNIPGNMYVKTAKKLSEAISVGYKTKLTDVNDVDMVYHLKNNVKVFSAFKANHMKEQMKTLLVDEDNKKRSWSSFLKEARKIDATYNTTWLAAEYNLATRQARSAEQWQTFQRDKDVYPNLEYMESRAAHKDPMHEKLYGLIYALDDPFWNTYLPPSRFGCECWVKQTREAVNSSSEAVEELEPTPGIAGNSGKEKKVFTNSTPYAKGLSEMEKKGVEAFMGKYEKQLYEEIFLTVGKNKITVPLNADRRNLIENIEYLKPFVKKYKESFEIRANVIKPNVKNPEYAQGKIIGDLATWKDDISAGKWVNTLWNSKISNSKGQLKKFEQIFLAMDFDGRLNASNIEGMCSTLYGKLNISKRTQFVLLKNGSKLLKIENKNLSAKTVLDICKKGLIN